MKNNVSVVTYFFETYDRMDDNPVTQHVQEWVVFSYLHEQKNIKWSELGDIYFS